MKAFQHTPKPATLVELLRGRALADPVRRAYTFLTDGETQEVHLTLQKLDQRARAIGASLQDSGAKGERVLLLYPPGLEYIAAFFGCLYAGAVAVPVYPPRMNQNLVRLESIIKDSQPALTLTTSLSLSRSSTQLDKTPTLKNLRYLATDTLDDELAEQWQDLNVTSDNLAFLQYTSGSTSEPKGVMVSHANLLHNAQMMKQACGHPEDPVFVSWLPLYHDMGLIGNVLQSLFFGATCVIMSPTAFLQQPFRWLNAISRYQAHTSGGPNFAYDLCVRRISAAERATLNLSSWKVAFNGAEPVYRDTLERFAETFAMCGFRREAFYPCYGLAEATLFVSGGLKESAPTIKAVRSDALKQNRVVPHSDGEPNSQLLVSCGQTLPQNKIVITNPETLVPCPPNQVGEIWLLGPSVAHGYWNRVEENELCFNARHVNTGDGPYLRTGDLGFIDEGELFIVGRLKDLIIIRGLNHHPQDIEQTVERCSPALRPGCGASFSVNVMGEERLVVVHEINPRHKEFDLPSIIESIRQAVAVEHELQVYAVALITAGSIPKTSSGKIRRRACREAFINGSLEVLEIDTLADADPRPDFAISKALVLATPFEERRELVESYLEHCVRRLFHRSESQLARHQSLWKLGLDSLVAFELSTEIAAKLGVEVRPAELLEGPSIVDLAEQILPALHTRAAEDGITSGVLTSSIEPAPRNDAIPVSSTQLRLWFLDQLVQGSPLYNIPVGVRLSGALNLAALELSLNTIIGRHESLRTTFRTVSGEPVQVIAPALTLTLDLTDVSGPSESDREAELQRLVDREARRPFDLAAGPLIRVTLLRLVAHEHVLLIVLHHIIADGWSVRVLIREMLELYDAYSDARTLTLPELTIQYADYAVWEQKRLRSAETDKHLSYWKQQLGEQLPLLRLPSDRPRPAELSYQGARKSFRIDQNILSKLRKLGEREQTTLFTIMVAALNILLYRYTGQHDIVIGTPIANRSRKETALLIGCFVNTLAVRTSIASGETFRHFLGVVKRVMLDAYLHQEVPFEKVVEELQPHRSLSHAPLFQVMLAFQNYGNLATKVGELTLSRMEVESRTAQFDLLLFIDEDERGLSGSFEYSTDLFDEATITRMVGHFTMVLQGVADNPDEIVSAVPLLTEPEHNRLVVEWNRTTTAFPTGNCLHDLFELQVRQTPNAIALISEREQLTYRELNQRANQLASRLQRLGVRPEVLVGLCVDRSSAMVIGMLGILKAGGAYLPLDPSYPKDRLTFMLEDGGVAVLVTQQALLGNLPQTGAQVICLDHAVANFIEEKDEDPAAGAGATNLAYIIYTSGSTGQPKGVAIQHQSAVTLMYWANSVFSPDELSGVLASTSICFDLSVFEIFVPLSWGGTVILTENALQLPALLAAAKVTLINTVPSAMSELLKLKNVPSSVRTVNLAGEPLRSVLAQQVLSATSAEKLYNLYGPSEDTTYSTFACLDRDSDFQTTIGRPIANTEAYILDQHLNLLPVGVTGELYLSGEGLARGYLNRPDVTATRFLPNPFSVVPGRRIYRTGDLARYLPDGNIDFLGRGDSQVKIRGFRIELGEIQSVLLTHPALKDATVKVYGEDSDRQLVAYLVAKQQETVPSASELRKFLSEKLPDFMIPSAFIALERMPLTPNGKIDREALAPPERTSGTPDHLFISPRNKTEELVASIWSDLLGIQKISIFDNFFELGGHSLLATRFVSRVREDLQVELSLRAVFLSSTIADLAQNIDALNGQIGRQIPAIQRVPRTQPLPLSFAQQRLWLLNQIESSSPFYNICGGVRLKGSLGFHALQQSLNEIVRRHEILRTGFATIDDQPCQLINSEVLLALPIADLQNLDQSEREAEISRLVRREAQRPFDLQKPPLLRVSLIRVSEQEHVLILSAHHIVFDGWSIEVFIRELSKLYEAFATGKPSPLAELPIQFADYASWQREWLSGETLETQRRFWKKQLAGDLPVLDLPADRPRPPIQTFRGARQRLSLSADLTSSLKSLSNKNGATLFVTLLAAFNVLLHRYTGQQDILIGSPIANRNRLETEDLIGFFVNTIVIRTDLSGQPSFEELLQQVRETTLAAYATQDMPFEQLVEELQPERDLSRTPLFQIVLSLLKHVSTALELPGLSLTQWEADTGTAKFDLSLQIEETADRLGGWFEYNTDLFDAGRIARMASHFEHLLEALVNDPARPISTLPVVTPAEQTQILSGWNNTFAPSVREVCVHQMFELQVEQRPNALALATYEAQLSFRQLNERANRVARRLRSVGVGPEVLVGVYVNRSIEMVVGLLGILKAGGAYVPLDPADPHKFTAFKLTDAGITFLLTARRLADSLPEHSATMFFVDDIMAVEETEIPENLTSEVRPENLAYVIYTSGSTGQSKGVGVPHAGLANLINWHQQTFATSAADRATQLARLEFDASVLELWPLLTAGASIYMPDDETRLSSAALLEWLTAKEITFCFLPTPLGEAILQEAWPNNTSMRVVTLGGDKLQARPSTELPFELFNFYGPTENSVVATAGPVDCASLSDKAPDIGGPISNVQTYLLDPYMQMVPAGIPGELHIGGESLARGYLNRPDLTAEKFVPNPFSREPGQRLYKTGDVCAYAPDGRIEFLGRIDHQVKIRGCRIELGEIEAVLSKHEAVQEAVVLAREDKPGQKRLVAYVLARSELMLRNDELRKYLRQRLPEYMVPRAWLVLDHLPLTANGKLDRKALELLPLEAQPEKFPAPANPTAEMLAAIWAEVLGIKPPGLDDNFFEIGGHSLVAAQIMSRVRKVFQVDLRLRSLFETPTVAGLAKLIDDARRTRLGLPTLPLAPVPRDLDLPLSFAQERLWFLQRLHPDSAPYNISGAVRISGRSNAVLVTQSINEIIRRHESLRTTIQTRQGQPVQVVAAPAPADLPVVDLSHLTEAERETQFQRLAREEARRPFDLSSGPLIRSTLIILSSTEKVLLLTVHHIIADGWSIKIFVKELATIWKTFAAGIPSPLPELTIQYADFAYWHRQWLENGILATELDYWKKQIAEAPTVLELPADYPRPALQTLRGGLHHFEISESLLQEIRDLSRREGVTLFIAFNSALQVLLHHYTGRDDLVVGTDIAERNLTELEGLIGLFVNQVVLRTGLSSVITFRDLLNQVRDTTLAAYDHQQLPFNKLVEALKPELDLSRNPLFQVMIVFQGEPVFAVHLPQCSMTLLQTDAGASPFDISLLLAEDGDTVKATFRYNTDLFKASRIARMAEHFELIVRAVVEQPDIELGELSRILTESDQQRYLTQVDALKDVRRQKFEQLRSRVAQSLS